MKTITIKAKSAINFSDRLFGLLNPHNPRAMFFQTRFGIHTFFLKKKIDVLVLDDNNIVRLVMEGLKPFRLFIYPIKYQKVIELPQKSIARENIRLGDKIDLCLI